MFIMDTSMDTWNLLNINIGDFLGYDVAMSPNVRERWIIHEDMLTETQKHSVASKKYLSPGIGFFFHLISREFG